MLFISIVVFFIQGFLRHDVYFSNSNSQKVVTEYFDIENKLTSDPSRPDTAILEIALSYRDKNNANVERGSMKVYPTIGGLHSLQQFSSMASHYYFNVPMDKLDNSSLDLLLKFKLDSSNKVIDRSISFKELKTINRYRWSAH